MKIVPKIGILLIILTNLITVGLWLSGMGLWDRFGGVVISLVSVGQISGLLGMVMYAQSIILSARVKWMEKLFGGMDKIYVTHHILGGLSFILLLIHPLVLALSYLPESLKAAGLFFVPPAENWPVYFGISSLLFMMTFLVVTFFVKLPYQLWKQTHKLLGVAFFLGGLHSFFISSDISYYPMLRYYMMSISVLAMGVWVYRSVLGFLLVRKYGYVITKVEALNETVTAITMTATGKKMPYNPGQFIFVSFDNRETGREYHPFSLSSAPQEETIQILIKSLGDFTRKVAGLPIGTKVKVEGAYGKFYTQFKPEFDQIWIAGGIGIAPFAGMAKSLDIRNNSKIDLYYCATKQEEMVAMAEFEKISDSNPNFRIFPFLSERYGRVDFKFISGLTGNMRDKEIYICGPPAMMKSLKKQFKINGIKKTMIHSEEFNFL
ncbi:ferric reductase-like transmembrane domain-containing protein [Candidatus Shapirobacteria bacterium]|nr:ferric reductase-like transmembrane domain-containing protein [Candidatus Shapirobacteria bacterium]